MLMRATPTGITDRRSTTGIDVTLGGAVVSHVGKTQRVVALSAEDAKYIAAGEGVKVTQVVRAVLSFAAPETSGASINGAVSSPYGE